MAIDFGSIPQTDMWGAKPISAGTFNFGLPDAAPTGGGENQYMNFPSMGPPGGPSSGSQLNPLLFGGSNTYNASPAMTTASTPGAPSTPPGIVPPQTTPFPSPTGYSGTPHPPPQPGGNLGGVGGVGATGRLPGQTETVPTLDPLLTQALDAYLRSQLGAGMQPFDLSAILPSTGGVTAPGTLTAPENPILQQLQKFYQTGEGGPLPGVLPMWQSEMKAMDIPIQKQLANIKEQFGARGALGSSELASSLETYGAQTAADQEALLGQLTLEALPGMEQFGAGLQQLDQASIDRLLQEFERTQPQNNPLFQDIFGLGTTFPPVYGKQGFGSAFMGALGSALGGSLGTFGLSNKSGTATMGG